MPTRDEIADVIDARLLELLGEAYEAHQEEIRAAMLDAIATGIVAWPGSGGGGITGPGTTVVGHVVVWDSTDGTVVEDGGELAAVALSNDYDDLDDKPTLGTAAAADVGDFDPAGTAAALDAGDVGAIPASYLDTDGTLAANSDAKVATQKATRTYADTKIGGTCGTIDNSLLRADGTGEKTAQAGSGVTLSDSGVIAGGVWTGSIQETSGPTNLTVGAIANNQYLRRSGTAIIGVWIALAVVGGKDGGLADTNAVLRPGVHPVMSSGSPT